MTQLLKKITFISTATEKKTTSKILISRTRMLSDS